MRKVFALVFAVLMMVATIGCESKPTTKAGGAGGSTPAGGGAGTTGH